METLGASEQGRASWKPPINLRLKEVRSHLNTDELNSKGLSGKLEETASRQRWVLALTFRKSEQLCKS